MPPQDTEWSHETSQDSVEISQDNAITIADAIEITSAIPFSIGKSTIQRWAKYWADLGQASPVKCVLVTTRTGMLYRLDKNDFEAWALEQKENQRSRETPPDLERPRETSEGPARSRETSQDTTRPNSNHGQHSDQIEKLKQENFNLRIDLEARKQLLTHAAGEVEKVRTQSEVLLRENGALQLRVRQLSSGEPHRPQLEAGEAFDWEGQGTAKLDFDVDNAEPPTSTGV